MTIGCIAYLLSLTLSNEYKNLLKKHPFLTVAKFCEQELVGIIQNRDTVITSFYDLNKILDTSLKAKFLELGAQWWWESNREIGINIFLKQDFVIFKDYLKSYNSKEFQILHGPVVSLNNMISKRPKRRSIQLVRRVS